MLATILVIILVLMLLGPLPTWPHSRNWGYYRSGGVGSVVLIRFCDQAKKEVNGANWQMARG